MILTAATGDTEIHSQSALASTKALLQAREVQAFKLITAARIVIILMLTPMAWFFGAGFVDRGGTLALVSLYAVVTFVSARLIRDPRWLTTVGLTGVAFDVFMIFVLPLLWYTALGGTELPFSLTLKTSVTLFALLMMTLNALSMRPLYVALVTTGALAVHLFLWIAANQDPQSAFTDDYLLAYTTSAVAFGKVSTQVSVVALVGFVLMLLTARARKMIVEAAELEKTNAQLGRYFSPNLVRRFADNPELLQVGGERKELSFVFTDLQGFTSLVESQPPSVVVPLLNGYLDVLVKVAFAHDGTVDKIVGDAVHVIFGAPADQPDHAARAVACALDMARAAGRFRTECDPVLQLGITRIGVNSGMAVVGNFGGDALFDYTAHGDAINVAARLEGANKYIGTEICISDTTRRLAGDVYGRPVGTLWLQGKSQGTPVFEPIARDGSTVCPPPDYLPVFELMEGRDASALAKLQELIDRYPDDNLLRFHWKRLNDGESGTTIVLDGK